MLTITQNLSHVGVKASQPGEMPYMRQLVHFKSVYDPILNADVIKVHRISKSKEAAVRVYEPSHPAADETGHVLESNVRPMVELIDMQETSHAHMASIRAFERVLAMLKSTISLMRPV